MKTKKFKKMAKRITAKKRKPKVVVVSGGFDPVHIGHVRMFNEAKKHGDKLVVILNNDNWLRAKKGYTFMSEQDRMEIIKAFAAVDEVMLTEHEPGTKDPSVCVALRKVRPDVFANGGDRKEDNIPEYALCEEMGTEMVFGIGYGGKVQSSSWLLAEYFEKAPCNCGSGIKFKECHGKK